MIIAKRIGVEVTRLDLPHDAREFADRVCGAIDEDTVDNEFVALLPQELADAPPACCESLDVEIVHVVLAVEQIVEAGYLALNRLRNVRALQVQEPGRENTGRRQPEYRRLDGMRNEPRAAVPVSPRRASTS